MTFNEAICTKIPESSKAAYLRATIMIASFYQTFAISTTEKGKAIPFALPNENPNLYENEE